MIQFIFTALILFATYKYPGTKAYYLCFSFAYFALVATAVKEMKSYSYLFLTIFLWLGFWFKFTVHMLFGYEYQEPIGAFVFSPESLDQVLVLATIGCLGVLAAHFLLSYCRFSSTVYARTNIETKVPTWYQKYRVFTWVFCLLGIVIVSILNVYYHIFQIGLVPQVAIMWPFNVLLYWGFGIGFALVFTTLMWWEVAYTKRAGGFLVSSLLEPFCNSISVLSRAMYIFHVLPVFLSFVLNRTTLQLKVKNRHLLAVLFLSGISFLISLQVVSGLRNYYYSGVSYDTKQNQMHVLVKIIENLAVSRWLGVEGVMAVSAYPDKNMDLLQQGLLERPDAHKVSMFQYICQSHYTKMDTDRFIFASLPGPVAFLYYSGAYWVVFIGMMVLTVCMILGEGLIFWLTGNVFLVSLVAMEMANTVAQFGVTPLMMLKHFLLVFLFCFLIKSYNRFVR